jgi:hypothetical protein
MRDLLVYRALNVLAVFHRRHHAADRFHLLGRWSLLLVRRAHVETTLPRNAEPEFDDRWCNVPAKIIQPIVVQTKMKTIAPIRCSMDQIYNRVLC